MLNYLLFGVQGTPDSKDLDGMIRTLGRKLDISVSSLTEAVSHSDSSTYKELVRNITKLFARINSSHQMNAR